MPGLGTLHLLRGGSSWWRRSPCQHRVACTGPGGESRAWLSAVPYEQFFFAGEAFWTLKTLRRQLRLWVDISWSNLKDLSEIKMAFLYERKKVTKTADIANVAIENYNKNIFDNTRDSSQGRNLYTLQYKEVTFENESKIQKHRGWQDQGYKTAEYIIKMCILAFT